MSAFGDFDPLSPNNQFLPSNFHDGAVYDFKNLYGDQYDAFGNFFLGAVGAALRETETAIQIGAEAIHVYHTLSSGPAQYDFNLGIDYYQIEAGYTATSNKGRLSTIAVGP